MSLNWQFPSESDTEFYRRMTFTGTTKKYLWSLAKSCQDPQEKYKWHLESFRQKNPESNLCELIRFSPNDPLWLILIAAKRGYYVVTDVKNYYATPPWEQIFDQYMSHEHDDCILSWIGVPYVEMSLITKYLNETRRPKFLLWLCNRKDHSHPQTEEWFINELKKMDTTNIVNIVRDIIHNVTFKFKLQIVTKFNLHQFKDAVVLDDQEDINIYEAAFGEDCNSLYAKSKRMFSGSFEKIECLKRVAMVGSKGALMDLIKISIQSQNVDDIKWCFQHCSIDKFERMMKSLNFNSDEFVSFLTEHSDIFQKEIAQLLFLPAGWHMRKKANQNPTNYPNTIYNFGTCSTCGQMDILTWSSDDEKPMCFTNCHCPLYPTRNIRVYSFAIKPEMRWQCPAFN